MGNYLSNLLCLALDDVLFLALPFTKLSVFVTFFNEHHLVMRF